MIDEEIGEEERERRMRERMQAIESNHAKM
jgi:hypothetical protein